MNKNFIDERNFYNTEALEVPIFGDVREIALTENIINCLPKKYKTIIDIGCGDGFTLYKLSKLNKKSILYGFDLSSLRLKTTKKNVETAKLSEGNILALPFKNNSFDVVICSETLEHINDYKNAIKELLRVAKKKIIVTVPNDLPSQRIVCTKCSNHFYFDGHVNRFTDKSICKIFEYFSNIKILKIKKFRTIFSYNSLTLKLNKNLRMILDKIFCALSKKVSFLKPEYLLVCIKKTNS